VARRFRCVGRTSPHDSVGSPHDRVTIATDNGILEGNARAARTAVTPSTSHDSMFLVSLAAITLAAHAQQIGTVRQDSTALFGFWIAENQSDVIAVARCGASVCATLVGISEVTGADTPRPAVCQRAIATGLTWNARRTRFEGAIVDPENNKQYRGALTATGVDRLSLRAWAGSELLNETYRYTRFRGRVLPNCRIERGS
jgi:uncharacterized protein (DUF2147 family)